MFLTFTLLMLVFVTSSFGVKNSADGNNYKCLIQLKNYGGKGAYVVISIVHPKDNYEEVLRVFGDDKEWYPDLTAWYASRKKNNFQPNLDGVTGASITSGGRSVITFKIEDKYLDKGYFLRFETGVEDKLYQKEDVSISLTKENLKVGKFEGKDGYIRQVRLIPVNK